MYWGASLMWLVDHVMAYLMEGGEFLDISADATLLGISVVILGLIIWLVMLLIKDPKKVFRTLLKN
jgi:uncharacterized membrane protein YhaH (DUF805 family)